MDISGSIYCILVVINGYSISGYWWLLIIIILMAISEYYIDGYC